jgi:hypothetical protein
VRTPLLLPSPSQKEKPTTRKRSRVAAVDAAPTPTLRCSSPRPAPTWSRRFTEEQVDIRPTRTGTGAGVVDFTIGTRFPPEPTVLVTLTTQTGLIRRLGRFLVIEVIIRVTDRRRLPSQDRVGPSNAQVLSEVQILVGPSVVRWNDDI